MNNMIQTKEYYNNISYMLDRLVPNFIKDQYPLFYDFIETYLEYCQQNDKAVSWNILKNIQNWNDVDTTLDEFADFFKKEFINLPSEDNWRFYIKHASEIYASKGSNKSLKFFIKLLSGIESDIFYPNRYLMKSSDGVYRSYKIIYADRDLSIDYKQFISTKLLGLQSESFGIIEKIEIYDSYIKIFLSSFEGTFIENETILFKNEIELEANIINTISNINITNAGNNYKVNELITISDHSDFICKITDINSGRLDEIEIVDGGSDYLVGDKIIFNITETNEYWASPIASVSEIDEITGEIKKIRIDYNGYGLTAVPSVLQIQSENGTGAVLNLVSNDAGSIKKIVITNSSNNYNNPSLVIDTENGYGAVLEPVVSGEFIEEPYYFKAGSFLSDVFKLQDSHYWQEYSYVINIASSLLNQYIDIFRKIFHPAGFIYFINTVLSNFISLEKEYINSTITITEMDEEIDINQYIELLQYVDRVLNNNILYTYKSTILNPIKDKVLGTFEREGGNFVNSSIEITEE